MYICQHQKLFNNSESKIQLIIDMYTYGSSFSFLLKSWYYVGVYIIIINHVLKETWIYWKFLNTEEKASYSTWKRHPMIWIGKVTDNEPFHGSQPCCGAGACITHWIYEPCHAGPPKTDGSYWRVLTKCGPQEEGLATHSNILAWNLMDSMKRQKDMTPEDEPRQVERCPICYWGRVEGNYE